MTQKAHFCCIGFLAYIAFWFKFVLQFSHNLTPPLPVTVVADTIIGKDQAHRGEDYLTPMGDSNDSCDRRSRNHHQLFDKIWGVWSEEAH